MRSRREEASGWPKVLAMGAKYFGRKRQAVMAKIVLETNGLHINCEFYRLNVNLRALVRPIPLKKYER
jgi:hypothetical protein